MIYFIISIDPSTEFLFEIINRINNKGLPLKVIEVYPNDNSYKMAFDEVANIVKGSTVIYLGHGRSNLLYGGECRDSTFQKKAFIKLNEMIIFEEQSVFLLACDSAGLIKSSFRLSKMTKSIGFGGLPTSIEELKSNKRLMNEKIYEQTIENFKQEIVSLVSHALLIYHHDFYKLADYLTLLIDKRINNAVLQKKDRNLADLLFKMRDEMILI